MTFALILDMAHVHSPILAHLGILDMARVHSIILAHLGILARACLVIPAHRSIRGMVGLAYMAGRPLLDHRSARSPITGSLKYLPWKALIIPISQPTNNPIVITK